MTDPSAASPEAHGDIAIIGMACRYPGAHDKQQLWSNLVEGRESLLFLKEHELEAGHPFRGHPRFVGACGHLADSDCFDAPLFGISDRVAERMTPAHRLFIESAWEAMEDGGYDPERFPGEVAIYGASDPDSIARYSGPPDPRSELDEYMQHYYGWAPDSLASNALYYLGLKGEAVGSVAMCAGFHYSVHFACQALLLGQADLAIAGAAHVRIPLRGGHLWQEGQILSRDGHCRPFDAAGTGTVLGSGVAALLLKPLAQAVGDGDHIYAVIKGTAVNNNGARAPSYGIAQPDRLGACIASALAVGDIEPETITFLEAFGVGLPMADAVELQATRLGFQTRHKGYCAVGSVKSNIGHCGAASGGASTLKAALSLYHRQLVPTLHFQTPNPEIDFSHSPFYVQREHASWEPDCGIRRAGTTSLGGGGHNAHLVLEEAPTQGHRAPEDGSPLVATLSARTEAALAAQLQRLREWVASEPAARLDDICHTLNVGRREMTHRWAAVVRSRSELLDALAGRPGPAPVRRGQVTGSEAAPFDARLISSESGLLPRHPADTRDPAILAALAGAWSSGHRIAWARLHEGRDCRRVSLPTYPFERRRYWLPSLG